MTEDKALATQEDGRMKAYVGISDEGFAPKNLDEAWRLATSVVRGGMTRYKDPGAVVAIWQAGWEIGLKPMFALTHMTFINHQLGIDGDGMNALVRMSGKLRPGTGIDRRWEGEGDDRCAIITTHRVEEAEPVSTRYTVGMAKVAGLWKKPGPWTTNPDRMLAYRALGFHCRDNFPDVLGGIAGTTDELRDANLAVNPKGRPERDVTPAPEGPDPLLAQAEELVEGDEIALTVEDEAKIGLEPGTFDIPCEHPDGFSAIEGSDQLVCIHCCAIQQEDEDCDGELFD